jgi:hypothetical protein
MATTLSRLVSERITTRRKCDIYPHRVGKGQPAALRLQHGGVDSIFQGVGPRSNASNAEMNALYAPIQDGPCEGGGGEKSIRPSAAR